MRKGTFVACCSDRNETTKSKVVKLEIVFLHFRLLHFGCEVLEEGLLLVEVRDAVRFFETISELSINCCELRFLLILSRRGHLVFPVCITQALYEVLGCSFPSILIYFRSSWFAFNRR